jgi:plastocyanin
MRERRRLRGERHRTPAGAVAGAGAAGVAALLGGAVALIGAGAASGAPATAAASSTLVVHWNGQSFSPSTEHIVAGQSVAWRNDSGLLTLRVKSSTGNWHYGPQSVAPGKTSPAHRFSAKGSYGYQDPRLGGASGSIVVAAKPKPTTSPTTRPTPTQPPTHPPTHRPSSRPTGSPRPVQLPKHHPSAHPSASPIGQIGNPTVPGLGPGLSTPSPTPGVPLPQVIGPVPATPGPVPAPSPSVTAATTATGLTQPVPVRKFGLPAAIAAVVLAGLVVAVARRVAISRVAVAPAVDEAAGAGDVG